MLVLAITEAAVAFVASLVDEATLYAVQSTGALAHGFRQRIVSLLLDHGPMRRERLAELVVADESVPRTDPERVEIDLHHRHLPRLDDELIVDYDQRNGDVALWMDPDEAAELLESS